VSEGAQRTDAAGRSTTATQPGRQVRKKSKNPEFSIEGREEFSRAGELYLTALEQASIAVARRKQADSISAPHVQLAVDALDSQPKKRIERIREIGILLIGAGFGYLSITIFGDSYTFKNALLSFIPLLVGFAFYAYSLGRSN
jgi:hypothetical protein